MRRLTVIVLLLLLYAPATHCLLSKAEGTSFPVSVPFDAYGTFVIVPVRINGSPQLSFILDTGVRMTQVNARLKNTLALGKSRRATLEVAGVVLKNSHIHTPSFDDLEGALGRHIDGLFGYDFFRRFVVEIDYQSRRLTLYDPQTYQYKGAEQPIHIRISDGCPFISGTLELRDGKSVSAAGFELDTGSTGSLELYADFVQHKRLLESAGPTITDSAWSAGGQHEELVGRVEKFQLGYFTLRNPIVNFPGKGTVNFGPSEAVGLIGAQILQRFKVILDYTHRWLILEPNEGLTAAFEWDMSGILLNTVGSDFSRYEISGVLERSPGAEAGIREGDTLIAIDGTPVAKLGLSKIEGLFKQEGREFRLEIQRNEQNFEIRLKTRRLV